jgi:hypothetical protein
MEETLTLLCAYQKRDSRCPLEHLLAGSILLQSFTPKHYEF